MASSTVVRAKNFAPPTTIWFISKRDKIIWKSKFDFPNVSCLVCDVSGAECDWQDCRYKYILKLICTIWYGSYVCKDWSVVLTSYSLKTRLHTTKQILVARRGEDLKIVISQQCFAVKKWCDSKRELRITSSEVQMSEPHPRK
jgi:hypothetical protein